jgi:hypothetical protein
VPLALLLPRFCLLASVTVVEAKEKRNPYQAIRKNIPFILKHIGADIFGLLWAVGAIISLQFAIDSGVNHAWKSATVIILFTAGFGGCLCISHNGSHADFGPSRRHKVYHTAYLLSKNSAYIAMGGGWYDHTSGICFPFLWLFHS